MIPTPLWLVLFFSAGLIFVFMLFFADSGERAVVQALLIGSVVAVITAMLLLLNFLDNPFHDGIGGLRPVAMERTLEIIDQELTIAGQRRAAAVRRPREPAVGGGVDWLTSLPAGLLVVGCLAFAAARRASARGWRCARSCPPTSTTTCRASRHRSCPRSARRSAC